MPSLLKFGPRPGADHPFSETGRSPFHEGKARNATKINDLLKPRERIRT